jgi:hypothetical protein
MANRPAAESSGFANSRVYPNSACDAKGNISDDILINRIAKRSFHSINPILAHRGLIRDKSAAFWLPKSFANWRPFPSFLGVPRMVSILQVRLQNIGGLSARNTVFKHLKLEKGIEGIGVWGAVRKTKTTFPWEGENVGVYCWLTGLSCLCGIIEVGVL